MNETSIERKHRMMVLDTCKAPGDIEVRPSMGEAQPHPLDLMHAALGIAGEAGEVVDLIKKVAINGRELDLVDLTKELGDLEWYLTLLRSITGIDRQVCLEMNIEKLRARYFDGYSDKASLERIDVRAPEAFFSDDTAASQIAESIQQTCAHPTLEWQGLAGYVCSRCKLPAAAVQEDIA